MKKKFLSLFFIIFILNINHSLSSEKTVFIDIDFVLNNSYLGKSIYQELEKINKNNIKKLELKEENIKKKKDMINKTKNITSKEKLEKDIILFNQELEVYRVEKDKIFDQFKKKKQQDLENFLKQINPIIQDYMKTNSIDIVLDKKQIFIGNSKNDITQDILDLINKKFKE
tara:strand:+ start:1775 stop:2287 length:513 start_codon:yes stop_codon:yes gene_type:complete